MASSHALSTRPLNAVTHRLTAAPTAASTYSSARHRRWRDQQRRQHRLVVPRGAARCAWPQHSQAAPCDLLRLQAHVIADVLYNTPTSETRSVARAASRRRRDVCHTTRAIAGNTQQFGSFTLNLSHYLCRCNRTAAEVGNLTPHCAMACACTALYREFGLRFRMLCCIERERV